MTNDEIRRFAREHGHSAYAAGTIVDSNSPAFAEGLRQRAADERSASSAREISEQTRRSLVTRPSDPLGLPKLALMVLIGICVWGAYELDWLDFLDVVRWDLVRLWRQL